MAEHVDDYALDRGRAKGVRRQQLEVSVITGGPTLTWLGHSLNAADALHASQILFRAVQDAGADIPPRPIPNPNRGV